jgi:hypothetical protein
MPATDDTLTTAAMPPAASAPASKSDRAAILIARHITLHDHHFGAGLAAEIGGLFGLLRTRGIVDHDTGIAASRQNGRGRSAEAGRRTRYNCAQTILRHRYFLFLIF